MRATAYPPNWYSTLDGNWESSADGTGDGCAQAYRYAVGNLGGNNFALSSNFNEVHNVQAFYEDDLSRSL